MSRILLVLNKIDLVEPEHAEQVRALINDAYGLPLVFVSAQSETNLNLLPDRIRQLFEKVGSNLSPNLNG